MLSVSVCDDCANFWNAFTSFAHWRNILYTHNNSNSNNIKKLPLNRIEQQKKARAQTHKERERELKRCEMNRQWSAYTGQKKTGKIMRSTKSANINWDFSHKCMHNAIAARRTWNCDFIRATRIIKCNITRYSVLPLCWCCCRYRYGCW